MYDRGIYTNKQFSFDTTNVDLTVSGVSGSTLILGGDSSNDYKGTPSKDWIYGNEGEDTLDGGEGSDVLFGGEDGDTFRAGAGDDLIWGGEKESHQGDADGIDKVDYSLVKAAVAITVHGDESHSKITVDDGEDGTDTLFSIERIVGTAEGDGLTFSGAAPGTVDMIDLLNSRV